VRIGAPGGGLLQSVPEDMTYFYPHPKDTLGTMMEMCKIDMPNDPRLQPSWSETRLRWERHPLGIERLAYITIGVRDVDAASDFYERILEARPVYKRENKERKTRDAFFQLGHCIINLSTPTAADSPLGQH